MSRYSEAAKAWEAGRKRRAYAENRALIDSIKLANGCKDCGYRAHSCALEFDHLPGHVKFASLASMAGSRLHSPKEKRQRAILAEVAKCEVVCANCHAVRTHARRRAGVAQ